MLPQHYVFHHHTPWMAGASSSSCNTQWRHYRLCNPCQMNKLRDERSILNDRGKPMYKQSSHESFANQPFRMPPRTWRLRNTSNLLLPFQGHEEIWPWFSDVLTHVSRAESNSMRDDMNEEKVFKKECGNTLSASCHVQSFSITEMSKKYGPLVWNMYWGIYFGTLGGLFLGVQSGLLNPLRFLNNAGSQPQTVAEYAGAVLAKRSSRIANYAPYVRQHPMAANLLVAWLIAEASEPLRLVATGALVPVIAKWKRKREKLQSVQAGNEEAPVDIFIPGVAL